MEEAFDELFWIDRKAFRPEATAEEVYVRLGSWEDAQASAPWVWSRSPSDPVRDILSDRPYN